MRRRAAWRSRCSASQLGQTREVIEAMRLGSGAAGTTGGPAEYASFVRRLGVLGLPFLWKSYDHALAVLDGPVGKELDQDMEKGGFKVLGWARAGATATSSPRRRKSSRRRT